MAAGTAAAGLAGPEGAAAVAFGITVVDFAVVEASGGFAGADAAVGFTEVATEGVVPGDAVVEGAAAVAGFVDAGVVKVAAVVGLEAAGVAAAFPAPAAESTTFW